MVSVLGYVVADRLLAYRAAAEKVAVEQTVGSLQSALTLQFSGAVLRGGDLEALGRENPVRWLARRPDNYLGEYYDPKPGEAEPGNWYFDLMDRQLVYVVKFRARGAGAGPEQRLRFRVRLVGGPGREVSGAVIEPAGGLEGPAGSRQ